jgi:hypothetical protein
MVSFGRWRRIMEDEKDNSGYDNIGSIMGYLFLISIPICFAWCCSSMCEESARISEAKYKKEVEIERLKYEND